MKTRYIRYTLLSIILLLVLYLSFGFGNRSFEAFCPFGGMESLWGLITNNEFSCALGPLNLSMLAAVLVLTILAKKAFCGWICPIGFMGELTGKLGGKLFPRRGEIDPKWNFYFKLLRYPILVISLYFTYKSGELILRGYDPFYIIFSGFGHGTLGLVTFIVLAATIIGSLLIPMFFCRYLCPLGATLDPFSRIGFIKVARMDENCNQCGMCKEVCPHAIAPHEYDLVRNRDCTNCLECVDACPEEDTLNLKLTL